MECFLRSENRTSSTLLLLLPRFEQQKGEDAEKITRTEHVFDAIQSNFKHVKNIPRLLKTLGSGRGGLKEWQTIWQVRHVLSLSAFLCLPPFAREAALMLSS